MEAYNKKLDLMWLLNLKYIYVRKRNRAVQKWVDGQVVEVEQDDGEETSSEETSSEEKSKGKKKKTRKEPNKKRK